MLVDEFKEESGLIPNDKCNGCESKSEIFMTGYSNDYSSVVVCAKCALQLARKLLEDLCELAGDRHG